jgi:hypothetical protein
VFATVEDAAAHMGIDNIDFFVRDTHVVHLCVHSTCPHCNMAFGSRDILVQHLNCREKSGNCFSS